MRLSKSNSDYINAIKQQQSDYCKTINEINNNIEINRSKEIERHTNYSPSWIEDLIKQFGKDFIKNNSDAVIWSLKAISSNYDEQFEKHLKDLIYTEAMLYGSYRRYFKLFLNFYKEELNEVSKKKLNNHKNAADAFLAILSEVSFTFMHDTTVLNKKLDEDRARNFNDDVYIFLKNHPLSNTFGHELKPLKDFMKAIEN